MCFVCRNCGESMVGDGYSVVYHCPFVMEDELWMYSEPDADPVYCNPGQEDILE